MPTKVGRGDFIARGIASGWYARLGAYIGVKLFLFIRL